MAENLNYEKNNRRRKANWSCVEISTLVNEVTDNAGLVSAKFDTNHTAASRQQFWCQCAEKINSVAGNKRSVVEVLKKWTELKSQTKKKERKRIGETQVTGGGCPPSILLDWEEKIISLLPQTVLTGIDGGTDTFVIADKGYPIADDNVNHVDDGRGLNKRTAEEMMMASAIETTISQSASRTSTSLQGDVQSGEPTPTKRKGRIEDSCGCTSTLIKLEEEKLKEQVKTRQTLEKIEGHLGKLVEFNNLCFLPHVNDS